MNATEIDKLIENWTQEERGKIHGALAKLTVGTFKIDDATNTWCMPMAATVGANMECCVSHRIYQQMKPAKLIILEPEVEIVETEVIVDHVAGKIEKTWWRTRDIEPPITRERRIEHRRIVTVGRGIWTVRGMFIGATCALPTEKDIGGDLFGPDGALAIGIAVQPGLDVSLMVKNTAAQELPFRAVLIGRVPMKTLGDSSAIFERAENPGS